MVFSDHIAKKFLHLQEPKGVFKSVFPGIISSSRICRGRALAAKSPELGNPRQAFPWGWMSLGSTLSGEDIEWWEPKQRVQ